MLTLVPSRLTTGGAVVALALAAFFSQSQTVDAACGDYVLIRGQVAPGHTMTPGEEGSPSLIGRTTHEQSPRPLPNCRGAFCSGEPAPAPIPVPAGGPRSFESAVVAHEVVTACQSVSSLPAEALALAPQAGGTDILRPPR